MTNMSFRNNQEDKKNFFKNLFKGLGGAAILLILLGFWLGWDGFHAWFYNNISNYPIEEGIGDPLLLWWLLLVVPLLACGIAMLVSGGIKAYRLAVPPKEED